MRKCLDSILAQTFQDYECLLIDDGSSDGSPAICDEYAARDSRFKAFHKPNGGLSDARNYGLAHARGEYTIFFDPDDWVDEDCLQDLYAKAQEKDADMVMCDIYYNDKHGQRYHKMEPSSLYHYDVLKDILMGRIYGFTVTKFIRRSLYDHYKISYPKGIYGSEDQYAMCELLKNDIRIDYLPKAYYHYMHFGNETQSRRYDMSVYQMDVYIRSMFSELLEGSPYKQIAYDCKSINILHRAFLYGSNTFSSHAFKQEFISYKKYCNKSNPYYYKYFYNMSIVGFYQLSRKLFGLMLVFKQIGKELKAWLR